MRRVVGGALPPGDHYPYLILPGHEQFFSHLWTQLFSYSGNLAIGFPTQPFGTWDDLLWIGQFKAALAAFGVLAAAMGYVMWRDPRARFPPHKPQQSE